MAVLAEIGFPSLVRHVSWEETIGALPMESSSYSAELPDKNGIAGQRLLSFRMGDLHLDV